LGGIAEHTIPSLEAFSIADCNDDGNDKDSVMHRSCFSTSDVIRKASLNLLL
jgi:hypothetical protein